MFLVGHVTKTGDLAGSTLLAPLCCMVLVLCFH